MGRKGVSAEGGRELFLVIFRIAAKGLLLSGDWEVRASPAMSCHVLFLGVRWGRLVRGVVIVSAESGSRIITLSRDSGVGVAINAGVLWGEFMISSIKVIWNSLVMKPESIHVLVNSVVGGVSGSQLL